MLYNFSRLISLYITFCDTTYNMHERNHGMKIHYKLKTSKIVKMHNLKKQFLDEIKTYLLNEKLLNIKTDIQTK